MSPRLHWLPCCISLCVACSFTGSAAGQLKFREVGSVRPVSNESPAGEPVAKSEEITNTAGPKLEPRGITLTKVSDGNGVLPRDHNQKWREYDIRPYTSRVTTTERPEQAVIDWILRETGTEVWFTEPFGILNAGKDTLRVYHTDEMHSVVCDIVDRLVSSQAESHAFGVRLVTVANPNWRAKALPLMRSVTVQSPGVDAWLLSKENAAILISELRKRVDFREHNSPNLMIHNGQSQTISAMHPRNYTRSVRLRENAFPAYEMEMGQIQEGYSLQISPLLALDERSIDAVLKCQIDQVEKLLPVSIDVPTVSAARQSVQVQVPQLVSWRLHERFRWPTDQVLLLSCGVVATPTAERSPLGLPKLLGGDPGRADALLFIESNGKASQTLLGDQRSADRSSPNYRGRY
ncbi:MAG: hypothetical protein O3C40_14320 [Planctomycetota bacterium]|nr:hypothetical protein [Planctomycetota bacterium]